MVAKLKHCRLEFGEVVGSNLRKRNQPILTDLFFLDYLQCLHKNSGIVP
jgi:hypothetical protein